MRRPWRSTSPAGIAEGPPARRAAPPRSVPPPLSAVLDHLHQEGDVVAFHKPGRHCLAKYGGRKRSERFPPLDLCVEDFLHVGPPRVTEDGAIAQRPRSP